MRVKLGAEGGSVEGGGVEESAVGGRGGDESDESDVESVEFVGVNFYDRAGARVEASGGDDGAVVAGEVGDGKSGNGGVGVDGEVGFVVKKARGGDDGKSGGVEGGVEGDGMKVDPKNPFRKCHFCNYCGQNLKRHIQKHHRGQCKGEGAVLHAIFVETQKKTTIREEKKCGGQQI